jgi:hypothetical protein
MLIGSTAVANIRRIQRYLEAQRKAEKQQKSVAGQGETAQEGAGVSIFSFAKTALAAFRAWLQPQSLATSW